MRLTRASKKDDHLDSFALDDFDALSSAIDRTELACDSVDTVKGSCHDEGLIL